MTDRPLRYCDVCGGLDDLARHVWSDRSVSHVPTPEFLARLEQGPVSAVALLVNPAVSVRHLSCCAESGCVTCAETVKGN